MCVKMVIERESEILQIHQKFEVGWVWDISNAGTVLKDI